ncbi:hypothetical protein CKO44_21790 [Rubrivivax gelatinosus]|uniref:glycosyltransferase family 2 protein n=1 Tax=Rubrivivax gelatinosus TaxID=28068 RepID=UPI0019041702|nr:glycosyltransferase family 2 protein [Rubrivivax gelatinosus]MBK1616091.1 hypothetical protein [Rubrivivax gelatinosus]MBZ8143303.1 hypothetical protein [Rubrivivax gelatinosus]
MHPDPEAVSVVVPYGKRDGDIERCVRSALAQGHAPQQVLVVANHAVDAGEACSRLGSIADDPRLRIVDGSACRNANQARNLGARLAATPWIALLDSDDWWDPQHLQQALDVARAQRADMVYGSIRVHGPADNIVLEACHFRRLGTPENYLLSYLPAQTSSYVFRRELVERQPWAEHLRRHQDYEWFARVAQHFVLAAAPVPTVHVEWLDERRHKYHRDCWNVVGAWRGVVDYANFRRHHRALLRSAIRSRDGFSLPLALWYLLDPLRPRRAFRGRA